MFMTEAQAVADGWEAGFESVAKTTIDENTLHEVSWNVLFVELGQIGGGVLAYGLFVLAFTYGLPIATRLGGLFHIISPVLFGFFFLPTVASGERLMVLDWKAGLAVFLSLALTVGAVLPYDLFAILRGVLFFPLILFVVLAGIDTVFPGPYTVATSRVLGSLSGKKYLRFTSASDVYLLVKSLRYLEVPAKENEPPTEATLEVHNVSVNYDFYVLQVNGEEVKEKDFLLTKVLKAEESGLKWLAAQEVFPRNDGEKPGIPVITDAKKKPPPYQSSEVAASMDDAAITWIQSKGGKWEHAVHVAELALKPSDGSAVFQWLHFVYGESWAFRSVLTLLIVVWMSLPAAWAVQQLFDEFSHACSPGAKEVLVGGVDICGDNCTAVCGSVLNFVTAVNKQVHFCYAEVGLTAVMALVFCYCLAVEVARTQHRHLIHRYIYGLPVSSDERDQVLETEHLFEKATSITGIFSAWWTYTTKKREIEVKDLTWESIPVDSAGKLNTAWTKVTEKLSSVSDKNWSVAIVSNKAEFAALQLEERHTYQWAAFTSIKVDWYDLGFDEGTKKFIENLGKSTKRDTAKGSQDILAEEIKIDGDTVPKGYIFDSISFSWLPCTSFKRDQGEGIHDWLPIIEEQLRDAEDWEDEYPWVELTFKVVNDNKKESLEEMTKFLGGEEPIQYIIAVEEDDSTAEETRRRLTVEVGKWLAIPVFSIFFAFIIPLARVFQDHAALYPAPFTLNLALNTFASATMLCGFLVLFAKTTLRLSVISLFLDDFKQNTIDPSGQKKKKADPKAGGKEKAAAEAAATTTPAADQKAPVGIVQKVPENPFDLYLPKLDKEYNFWDPEWRAAWTKKVDNLSQWQKCQGYLRIFVSGSRLVAQAMLVAAAIIIGFVIALSILQAVHGDGFGTAFAKKLQKQVSTAADSAAKDLGGGKRALAMAGEARMLLANLAQKVASEPLATAAAPFNFAAASASLQSALQHLHSTYNDQIVENLQALSVPARILKGDDLGLGSTKNVLGDLSKVTNTQFLTICMAVLIITYSLPLIYSIAIINASFDEHAGLLTSVKSKHTEIQKDREQKPVTDSSLNDDLKGSVDDIQKKLAAKDLLKFGKVEEKKDGTGAEFFVDSSKDDGMRAYGRAVDSGIENSKEMIRVFPLSVFGFVINFTLLGTWAAMGASPVVSQVKQIAPKLAMKACNYIESSPLFAQLEHLAQSGIAEAGSLSGSSKLKSLSVQKIFHDSVCVPLADEATQMVKDAAKKAGARRLRLAAVSRRLKKAAEEKEVRRLVGEPTMKEAVDQWWATQSGSPQEKFAVAKSVLSDHQKHAHRRLEQVPELIRVMTEEHGWEAGLTLALHHLEEDQHYRMEL